MLDYSSMAREAQLVPVRGQPHRRSDGPLEEQRDSLERRLAPQGARNAASADWNRRRHNRLVGGDGLLTLLLRTRVIASDSRSRGHKIGRPPSARERIVQPASFLQSREKVCHRLCQCDAQHIGAARRFTCRQSAREPLRGGERACNPIPPSASRKLRLAFSTIPSSRTLRSLALSVHLVVVMSTIGLGQTATRCTFGRAQALDDAGSPRCHARAKKGASMSDISSATRSAP